jgi:hypothetical protein
VVTAPEMAERVAASGHELQPFDIVLVNTRAGAVYGSPQYVDSGCGFGRDATLWLLERGVRVTGTDGGVGMLLFLSLGEGLRSRGILRLFGKGIRLVSKLVIATLRSWGIWNFRRF